MTLYGQKGKEFVVPAAPQGQPRSRPRFRGPGYFVPATKFFAACQTAARLYRPKEPMAGPVQVYMRFYLPRPKKGADDLMYQAKRPDVDNIIKAVLDALTKTGWWKDDGCVAEVRAFKLYATANTPVGAFVSVVELPQNYPFYEGKT